MSRLTRAVIGLALVSVPASSLAQPVALALRQVVGGLTRPLAYIQDPSSPRVQYVVEQGGRIRVIVDEVLQADDFLDLSGVIFNSGGQGGEQGLLGLAFPADYGHTRRCYVSFIDRAGNTVVARFTRSTSDPLRADPRSRFDLRWSTGLRYIEQPTALHKGGTMRFGPDGYLYIGIGDGGSPGDEPRRAQDPQLLHGKMLRIDVHVPESDLAGFRVPPDNPFLDAQPIAALPEIWAFGFRNPWKFTVDEPRLGGTGALVVGDVGNDAREEIDYEPAGAGGRNYGWPHREGSIAGPAVDPPPPTFLPLTDPTADESHGAGSSSITGGPVYRGSALGPSHVGRYFYGDFAARRLYSIALTVDPQSGEATASDRRDHTAELGGGGAIGNVSSMETDSGGEIRLVSYSRGAVFAIEPAEADVDRDGLPDGWERRFGLDATTAAGPDGADGDPDADGVVNAQELARGTHPNGIHKPYLAEGATSPAFLETSIDIVNPADTPALATVTFQRSDGEVTSDTHVVGAQRRLSVDPKRLPGLNPAEFSTLVESSQPLVVSRLMQWNVAERYGAHAERAVEAPATEWFLAEGATHSGINLFYLMQNPSATPTTVEVSYLRPAPLAPIVKSYEVAPTSRRTIWVNYEDAALAATDVSATLRTTNGVAIVVERALYLDTQGQVFGAGHDGMGATAPADEWFLAEGATGPLFDLFVLIANPHPAAAMVEMRYLLPDGTQVVKTTEVAGNSRATVWVDQADPRLADTSVSTIVRSTNGVGLVVERAMWWGGNVTQWYEAHVSLGSTATASRWALAEGEVARTTTTDTYVLVANTGTAPDVARFTLLFEDRPPFVLQRPLAANARYTLNAFDTLDEVVGRRFGVLVESVGGAPLVVEGAVYSNAGGVFWAAGSNLQAARVP